MEPFTLSLLTNDEALDINQDPLGKPASRIAQHGLAEVWARPLFDGTTAVGLFNRGLQESKIKVQWTELKREGSQPVHDLWQHKDMGEQADGYETTVPPHGVVLIKVGKGK
jgi:alpha-galactosidase